MTLLQGWPYVVSAWVVAKGHTKAAATLSLGVQVIWRAPPPGSPHRGLFPFYVTPVEQAAMRAAFTLFSPSWQLALYDELVRQ